MFRHKYRRKGEDGVRTIKKKLAMLTAATLAVSTGLVGVFVSGTTAVADVNSIFINNADFGISGTCAVGDDSYDSSTSTNNQCSLGAALVLANSLASSQTVTVTLATGFAAGGGDIQIPSSPNSVGGGMMDPDWGGNSLANSGAYYVVSAPMTIDLKNKLGIVASGDQKYTTLAITGSGVNLLNASNIQSGMSAIVVANTARDVLIDGGQTLPSNGFWTHQFLVIQNGARNVTFRNYTVGNLSNSSDYNSSGIVSTGLTCASAAVCFAPGPGSVSLLATNILVDNVTFTSTRTGNNACNATDSTGCVNNSFVFLKNSNVSKLEIKNSTFSNLKKGTDRDSVILTGPWKPAYLSDLDFHGNTIRNSGSCIDNPTNDLPSGSNLPSPVCALIQFNGLTFTNIDIPNKNYIPNYIRNNTFVNDPLSNLNQPHAIAALGAITGTGPSGLTISDNYFDGFVKSSIWTYTFGMTTVTRNEIGPNSYSNPNPTSDGEPFGTAVSMYANPYSGNLLNTWYPRGSASMSWAAGQCEAQIVASAPSTAATGNTGTTPVTLDVYWTATNKAEVYVGSVYIASGSSATITIVLPQSLLKPDGSAKSGNLRFQTQQTAGTAYEQQPWSSNYSRLIPVPSGKCVPVDFSVEKLAYSDAARTQLLPAGSVLPLGSTVYFTYVLTNLSDTGSTTITAVTDNQKTDGIPVCTNITLGPSEVKTCTWQQVVTG